MSISHTASMMMVAAARAEAVYRADMSSSSIFSSFSVAPVSSSPSFTGSSLRSAEATPASHAQAE